jgi:hypothetical protein
VTNVQKYLRNFISTVKNSNAPNLFLHHNDKLHKDYQCIQRATLNSHERKFWFSFFIAKYLQKHQTLNENLLCKNTMMKFTPEPLLLFFGHNLFKNYYSINEQEQKYHINLSYIFMNLNKYQIRDCRRYSK